MACAKTKTRILDMKLFKNILSGEMKANIKNYLYFNFLKQKYSSFLKKYKLASKTVHSYSNKVWVCWLQGEENAPELVKKCIECVRKVFFNKEIIVITEENFNDYAQFPDFILQKYRDGKISKTHFSDLLRLQLLIQNGGIWIDSTCLITEYPEYIDNEPLFVFQNRERGDDSIAASSWFISSEKENPILTLTRDMLFDWWKNQNKLYHYFLVHFFFTMATQFYNEQWRQVPFYSNLTCLILQRELFNKYSEKRFNQIKKMSAVHKLTYKFKNKDISETFYDFILKTL